MSFGHWIIGWLVSTRLQVVPSSMYRVLETCSILPHTHRFHHFSPCKTDIILPSTIIGFFIDFGFFSIAIMTVVNLAQMHVVKRSSRSQRVNPILPWKKCLGIASSIVFRTFSQFGFSKFQLCHTRQDLFFLWKEFYISTLQSSWVSFIYLKERSIYIYWFIYLFIHLFHIYLVYVFIYLKERSIAHCQSLTLWDAFHCLQWKMMGLRSYWLFQIILIEFWIFTCKTICLPPSRSMYLYRIDSLSFSDI